MAVYKSIRIEYVYDTNVPDPEPTTGPKPPVWKGNIWSFNKIWRSISQSSIWRNGVWATSVQTTN